MKIIKTLTGIITIDETTKKLTQAEYDALDNKKDSIYLITDSSKKNIIGLYKDGIPINNFPASKIALVPSGTLTKTNVQEAIAENDSHITTIKNNLSSHTSNTSNPHNVTKSQVGLGNVDNTSDINKPVSTAQQNAIDDAKNSVSNSLNSHTSNTIVHITAAERTKWNDKSDITNINNKIGTSDISSVGTTITGAISSLATIIGVGTSSSSGTTLTGDISTLKSNLSSHTSNTTVHITAAERNKWNSKAAGDHIHTRYYDYEISRAANTVLAAPNGSNGSASFRKLVAADIPSLPTTKISGLGNVAEKTIRTASGVTASGWVDLATDQKYVPDMSFIAYWNGAYSGTASNLSYCSKGAFGTATTKNIDDFATNTLLTNQNLNNIVSPGFYNAGGSNTITNKPNGVDNFGLEVIHHANGPYYTQKLYTNTTQYTRKCINSKWGLWTEDKLTDTNTTYSTFVKSGAGAKAGLVPAPSTTAGTTKYLREDGTWTAPPNTNTWRGIQNNLTSDSTSDSLSAAQGKILKGLVDKKVDLVDAVVSYGDNNVSDIRNISHSYVGSAYSDQWYNVINIRHRNNRADGNKFGMIIYSSILNDSSLVYNKQNNGTWLENPRAILDSANYKDYINYANVAYYGSDEPNSNGWYKIGTYTLTGFGNRNARLLLTTLFDKNYHGIIRLGIRCNNSTQLNVECLKWELRSGYAKDSVKIVTNNNKWTLYVRQDVAQWGRIKVRVLESSGTSDNWNMTLSSNFTKESTAPTATATATDGSIVEASNSVRLNTMTTNNSYRLIGINTTVAGDSYGDTYLTGLDYANGSSGNNTLCGFDRLCSNSCVLDKGLYSIAIGSNTNASGNYSHAEGRSTTASGSASHAEVYKTIASGNTSHAEGDSTTASGAISHAEGYKTIASGNTSHAEGNQTSASGNISHAEGSYTNASGAVSHTEGYETTASGDFSHAEGYHTKASGRFSHAEGNLNIALKDYSHAEGYQTTASGDMSHAEGLSSLANSTCSHAEGWATKAYGESAHSEGYVTIASGDHSHAEGCQTTASNYASHAGGHYNATMTTGGSNANTTGTAFVIGNGSYTKRSNAFSVQYNGIVKAKSSITGSTTADYAEFFEWEDGNPDNEDRVGKFVTINNDKILIATDPEDYILGIISGEPFVLGNGDCDTWNGMFLRDEFNRTIYEPAPQIELDEETGEEKEVLDEDGNPVYYGTRPKLNPDYDPSKPYISRFDRKEWAPVGMLGVLSVIHDGTCKVNGYAKCNKNGIATACKRTDPGAYRVIAKMSDTVVRVIFR